MLVLSFLLALVAPPPFWETAEPTEWTDEEIGFMLSASPWVSRQGGAHFFLASAKPIRETELEAWRRKQEEADATGEFRDSEEYIEFLQANGGDYIVLAVHIPFPRYLLGEKDTRAMEKKCYLMVEKSGKQDKKAENQKKERHQIVGHFPPTPGDRFLRLVFPRVAVPDNGRLVFRLYVPGVPNPYREVIFPVRHLVYRGTPEW